MTTARTISAARLIRPLDGAWVSRHASDVRWREVPAPRPVLRDLARSFGRPTSRLMRDPFDANPAATALRDGPIGLAHSE